MLHQKVSILCVCSTLNRVELQEEDSAVLDEQAKVLYCNILQLRARRHVGTDEGVGVGKALQLLGDLSTKVFGRAMTEFTPLGQELSAAHATSEESTC